MKPAGKRTAFVRVFDHSFSEGARKNKKRKECHWMLIAPLKSQPAGDTRATSGGVHLGVSQNGGPPLAAIDRKPNIKPTSSKPLGNTNVPKKHTHKKKKRSTWSTDFGRFGGPAMLTQDSYTHPILRECSLGIGHPPIKLHQGFYLAPGLTLLRFHGTSMDSEPIGVARSSSPWT